MPRGIVGFIPIAAAVAVIATGCPYRYNLWIVNPCDLPLRVETYNDPGDQTPTNPAYRSVTVPARSKTSVEGAFSDPRGNWSLRVVGIPDGIAIDEEKLKDNTVNLPEEVCATTYHPPPPPP